MSSVPNDRSDQGDKTRPGGSLWICRYLPHAVAFLAILYALTVLWVFPKWTVDDAYITYRYAENLALHGQLAWNVGEEPVEGYTGVLLPMLLAPGIVAGVPPDLSSKIIGVLAFLLGALILYRIGRLQELAPSVIAALIILYVTLPMSFTHTLSGLETILFSSLLLVAVYQLLRIVNGSVHASRQKIAPLALMLLLVSLARPEGIAFAAVTLAVLIITDLICTRRIPWPLIARAALWYVIPMIAYVTWRWWYYDSLLPNTYYAKLTLSSEAPTVVSHLSDFWHRYLALPTAAAGLYFLGRITESRKVVVQGPQDRTGSIVPVATIVLFLVVVYYQYSRTAPMMDFSFRFFTPFYPLFLVLSVLLVAWGVSWRPVSVGHLRRLSITMMILAITAIGSQVFRHVKNLPKETATAEQYLNLIHDEHIRVGLFLRDRVPGSEWLVVHNDAGAIPYFSRLKTVDFGRLNDRFLARQTLSIEQEVNYLYAHNPGAVVFTSRTPDSVVHGVQAAAIVADSRFKEYILAAYFGSTGMPDYYELVFLRHDLVRD